MFASKNGEMGLFRQCFKAEFKILTEKLLPSLAQFVGGRKFATQISLVLNFSVLNPSGLLPVVGPSEW